MSFDSSSRTPPQALDVERTVLASIMIDDQALDEAMEYLSEECFYATAHARIFTSIRELRKHDKPADVILVAEELEKRGWLESVGGRAFLGELVGGIATAANIKYHVDILKDKAKLRSMITTAGRISTDCFEADANASNVVDRAEQAIFAIKDAEMRGHPESMPELLPKVFEEIQRYHKEGGISGIPSGFHDLDALTTGMHPGELIIIAARPGLGKTSLALSIALNVATHKARPETTAVFSLEMPKNQLIQRILCSQARIDMHRLRGGHLSPREFQSLAAAAGPIHEAPLYFDDTGSLNVMDLRAKCRRIKSKTGSLGLVIVDYLQLMSGVDRSENRQTEISGISRSLKEIAKEIGVPLIALSQLSRAVEQRTGSKRPQLSDLRESGSIEQDADVVLFISRDMYNEENPENANIAEILIAKQRNGPAGVSVKLAFISEYAAFGNLDTHHSDANAPEDF